MKQFFQVFKFEYTNYLKNRIFLGITLALVIGIGIFLSFPRITQLMGASEDQPQEQEKTVMALQVSQGEDPIKTLAFYSSALPDYDIRQADEQGDALKAAVEQGKYDCAVVLLTPLRYQYIVNNMNLYDTTSTRLDEVILSKYRSDTLEQLGVSPGQIQQVLTAQVESETVQTGKNQMDSFFYTYILMFMLYMAIVLYGQFVATGVAAEKSSRAMELLITAARPVNLMCGKIIGIGLAGLTQMTVILGSGFLFYNLNRSYWADNQIVASIFDMPLSILLYTVLFFVLGFFIYAFLFGALGSLASRSEDINTLTMPVVLVFIASFFIVMYSMAFGNVDSPLMVVCSYIPFVSPMAMFTRIAMGGVQWWEIVISVAILVVSTGAVAVVSAGIYRIGVLFYGKPPKLTKVFKMLRRKV